MACVDTEYVEELSAQRLNESMSINMKKSMMLKVGSITLRTDYALSQSYSSTYLSPRQVYTAVQNRQREQRAGR